MWNLEGAETFWRTRWFEALVGALACVVFLSCLGSMELWGKREQRLAAETLDTIDNGRWLIARIQGRPRLEKPPLPRWSAAALATVAGRCDEWIIRLPGALAALGTVALTYSLGRRIGGRSVGLCAAMVLGTTPLFITELRQAGNDGPLALFATLALYAAYRWLEPKSEEPKPPRRLAILFHGAMGLGFLCKGPMVLAIVAATTIPAALASGRFKRALRLWGDPWGLPLFLALALCWPVPVWLADPNALGVWMLEMGQKTGASAIVHRERSRFLLKWPVMILPWVVVGFSGVLVPFRRGGRGASATAFGWWFVWSWAIGASLMLGAWAVAKSNYYVPSLPGWSLLVALAWVRLQRLARRPKGLGARLAIRAQWGVWLVLGVSALAIPGRWVAATPANWGAMAVAATALGAAAVVGSRIGRKGASAPTTMLPALTATALAVSVCYGIVAPGENAARGHREIARRIDRAVPAEIETLAFFHELDEGLWFHLRGRRLVPVPGSQPRYNDAADIHLRPDGPADRLIPRSKKVLVDWLERDARPGEYFLMREKVHALLADDLGSAATVVLRESGAKRNGLVLLRIETKPQVASRPVRT